MARENAFRHQVKVKFFQGDLLEPFLKQEKKFEIIISNPPYIPTSLLKILPREVSREPVLSLDGGEDGLEPYRRLAPQAASLLSPGGFLALEIGWDQGNRVREILEKEGFSQIDLCRTTEDETGLFCTVIFYASLEIIPYLSPDRWFYHRRRLCDASLIQRDVVEKENG